MRFFFRLLGSVRKGDAEVSEETADAWEKFKHIKDLLFKKK